MESAQQDDGLLASLLTIRNRLLAAEELHGEQIQSIPAPYRDGARNLLHYIALRNQNLVEVQTQLADRGLSSLGRAEAHVLASIDAVLHRLNAPSADVEGTPGLSKSLSRAALAGHAAIALGPQPIGERPRIMVTMPTEAAEDRELVQELIGAGMDLARINCAHDGPTTWQEIATLVRAEADSAGREVRIAFDLAGPKLRTGSLGAGRKIVKVKPERRPDGTVERPAVVRFLSTNEPVVDGNIAVSPELIENAQPGDLITLRDARDRKRKFVVAEVSDQAVTAACDKTTYFETGTKLNLKRLSEPLATATVGDLEPQEPFIRVLQGDRLRIQRGTSESRDAQRDAQGGLTQPATITVELAEVFDAVALGHRLLIDDGRIESIVEEAGEGYFDVIVIRPARAKLKGHKGINLPDSALTISAITDDDRAALDAIAPLADLVSLSFVQSPQDIVEARAELAQRGRPDVALGIKIETAEAFAQLPSLLLQGLAQPPLVVMIARGDLAIEVGFDRLAEVQEEILWLSEAAHVPVIWATQVAESMAKQGVPTRAEVTDAAWASRAECVMLNKGEHIVDAVNFVDSVLQRMQRHQHKRTPLLGKLAVSSQLSSPPPLGREETQ